VVCIQEESEQIREQIRALHDRKSSLQLLSDYFRIRAQKYEVLGQLRQSESTFFVTGYLPKKQVPAMEKRLTEKYDIVFEAEKMFRLPFRTVNSEQQEREFWQRLVFPERERSILPRS